MSVVLSNDFKFTLSLMDNLVKYINKNGGKGKRNVSIYVAWKLGQTQKVIASEYGLETSRVHQICKNVSRDAKAIIKFTKNCS